MRSLLKFSVILLAVKLLVVNRVSASDEDLDIVQSFKQSGIVTGWLPKWSDSMAVVSVSYAGGVAVRGGNFVALDDVKHKPISYYWDVEKNTYYTLVMICTLPGSTSLQVRHMLVVNMVGCNVTSGEEYTDYMSPSPLPSFNPYRCVFLVYQQPGKIQLKGPKLLYSSVLSRFKFSVSEFSKEYNLGEPRFGNFFITQLEMSGFMEDVGPGSYSQDVDMETIFRIHEVVPDVLPEVCDSISTVSVTYASGFKVQGGNYLSLNRIKNMPTDFYWNAVCKKYYTVVMIDPDAPSRKNPSRREVRHLLIINILGNDVASGETYSPYYSPVPAPSTGLHRYIFLVYEQPNKLRLKEPKEVYASPNNITHWSVAKFAQDYKLGCPRFGNLFFSKYEAPANDG